MGDVTSLIQGKESVIFFSSLYKTLGFVYTSPSGDVATHYVTVWHATVTQQSHDRCSGDVAGKSSRVHSTGDHCAGFSFFQKAQLQCCHTAMCRHARSQ